MTRECMNCLWWNLIGTSMGGCHKDNSEHAQDFTSEEDTCKDWRKKETDKV